MLGASRASSTREYQVINVETAYPSTNMQIGPDPDYYDYHVVPGTVYIVMELFGGGGAGGAGDSTGMLSGQAGQGGGSGGYVRHKYASDDLKPNDIIKFSCAEATSGTHGTCRDGGCDGTGTYPYKHYESDGITEKYTFENILAGPGLGGIAGGAPKGTHDWGKGGTAVGGSEENITGGDAGERPADGGAGGTGSNGGDAPNGGLGGAGGIGTLAGSNGNISAGGGGGGGFGLIMAPPFNGGNGAAGNIIIKAYG